MKTTGSLAVIALSLAVGGVALSAHRQRSPAAPKPVQGAARLDRDYPVQPVSFESVHLTDQFWAPKIEINRQASIQTAFEQCEATGRVDNFIRAAAGAARRNAEEPEGAGLSVRRHRSLQGDRRRELHAGACSRIPRSTPTSTATSRKIAAAQEKDGYLYTTRTINPAAPAPVGRQGALGAREGRQPRAVQPRPPDEAAVAHYQATGKRTLLDVALRPPTCWCDTFGPGKQAIWPGHQITEMALVQLYRVTGKARYLDLAKFLLDSRRPDAPASSRPPGDLQPVVSAGRRSDRSGRGHAVRATYMYSGMADVAALTGDAAYVKALDAIWDGRRQQEAVHHRRHRRVGQRARRSAGRTNCRT